MGININLPIPGSKSFIWAEALWLKEWQMHAYPQDWAAKNIIKSAEKMELIRGLFNKKILIHSWFRPDRYNVQIGGKQNSWHCKGLAVDFSIDGIECDEVRAILEPKLEGLKIRCENLPKSNWVHIDLGDVGVSGRFFKP